MGGYKKDSDQRMLPRKQENEKETKDTAVTQGHVQTGDGNISIRFIAVYLPYDSTEPSPTAVMSRVVEFYPYEEAPNCRL
ncbi:hypothetical protein J6590_099444 [Homalodisca vitripennis]|nr:hypothetical protein J6590_099444 [Homalodisca vitripennis]